MAGNKFLFYFAAILFRAILDLSYSTVVAKFFGSEGFNLDSSIINYAFSWLIYLVCLPLANGRLFKVSDYFFATALLSVFAPLTSLYGLDAARPVLPVITVFAALVTVRFIVSVDILPLKILPTIQQGRKIALSISLVFVCFLVVLYSSSGIELTLNFSDVYEVRAINAERTAGGVLAYTNNWTYQIFNICLMAFALHYRRYIAFLVFFMVQIYFFSASGHKTVLFLPLLVLGVWLYFRKYSSLVFVPATFGALVVMSMLSFFSLNDVWMSSLFVRRLFYVPADLTFIYFDFFSHNEKVLWSNSILAQFTSYPYESDVPHVVGKYMGKEGMAANNGFVSSGYAHAGVFGVIFYSLILGFILRFINYIASGVLPIWLAVSLTVVPLRALLISSDLFTVMLTHGLIVAIVLMFFARCKNGE
ncbi:hypothetical protein [Stutzerimonas stutzeri]|uniref:hypothetical protein n=1 Tax=Stutzerimonas stutzeri TaxID=316 RepID=UPI001268EB6D|nr:hypothetical protein [Stutzerimonas stutzeri]